MKASIAHGIRPTALILGRDSHSPWNETDILFAKAYQRFLGEVCGQCGLPKYVCRNDDNRIQFKLSSDHCTSTAMVEKQQYDHSQDKNAKPEFGVRYYGEPYLTEDAIADGLELSDFRRPWMREEAKKRGLIESE